MVPSADLSLAAVQSVVDTRVGLIDCRPSWSPVGAPATLACMRSGCTMRCSSRSRAQAAAEPVSASSSERSPTPPARRPRRARAPAPSPPARSRPGPGCAGAGEHRHRADRVALVRHRARAAARRAGPRALAGLAHLVLGQQRHVARDLGEHAGQHPERRPAHGRTRIACQGITGSASPSSAATRAATAGARAPTGPPICTASSASRTSAEPAARGVDARQPAGGAQAERDRQRLLQQCPADHRRVAVPLGQPAAASAAAARVVAAAAPAPAGRSASAPCRGCPGWWRRRARGRAPARAPLRAAP